MRIDHKHRDWLAASLVILVVTSAGYVWYARTAAAGPAGGTWIGLGYGLLGTLMIAYAAFLGARKKMLLLRMGHLTWWLRGHLWIGLLALPMILFHGAFAFGGLLTTMMMSLLIAVVISGVLGVMLQHFLPTLMTGAIEDETTYEQIERTYVELRMEAYAKMIALCGPMPEAAQECAEWRDWMDKAAQDKMEKELDKRAKAPPAEPVTGLDLLRDAYLRHIAPFLRRPRRRAMALGKVMRATMFFQNLRVELDPSLHEPLGDLSRMCDEARQKARQVELHRWLHWWLLVHIPLSMALLVLIPVHAFMALYY